MREPISHVEMIAAVKRLMLLQLARPITPSRDFAQEARDERDASALEAILAYLERSQPTDTQGDLTERARELEKHLARNLLSNQNWLIIAAALQSEREAAAAEARRACEQIAERYADNPPSGDNNNTPEAFEQGMDHRAGAVDCALCIRDAIAALASPAPQEER